MVTQWLSRQIDGPLDTLRAIVGVIVDHFQRGPVDMGGDPIPNPTWKPDWRLSAALRAFQPKRRKK